MTVAVIDIGTNTVLLLVATVGPNASVTPLVYEQRAPRLGKGVDASGRLAGDAMDRTIMVLREYRSILEPLEPRSVVVCGTSAVRDAANRDVFAGQVRHAAGVELEVLSGDEEAVWTYRGAVSGLPGIARATVLDIGGGSTEITTGERHHVTASVSIDIGSVRLTERVLRHDPPLDGEVAQARILVQQALQMTAPLPLAGSQLVGVAGTATALAVLVQGLKEFSRQAVSGYRMSSGQVRDTLELLRRKRVEEIRALSEVMEGRADVVTAGALILGEVLTLHGFPDLIVSERGVRYGLVLREWERAAR